MKIKYAFANETVEIEVSEDWGNILIDLDRQEYNNDHKETRRHCSLEAFNADGTLLPSESSIEDDLIRDYDSEVLKQAIAQLEPYQRELVRALFIDEVGVGEYAKAHGLTQPAVSQQKATVLRKIKNFLK